MNITVRCKLLLALVLGCVFVGAAQQNDDLKKRISDAVLNVYNEEIKNNPNDYESLCGRANQYFINGDYLRALDDVERALKLTPTIEKDLRFEEYMLRAKIYDLRGDQEKRLNDLYSANKIDPSRINCLGLLAEANYNLGRYDDAEPCYQRILRIKPNNYDALAGLARVEVQRKNYGKAAEYVDRAVKLYPAEPMVYINRAEVLIMMEQYQSAAQDLISALSVGKNNQDAIESLTAMSDVQYDAVISALNNSIHKAPRNGMFYYLAAEISMSHNHFADAEYYFELIIANKLYDYHSIYAELAKAQYCLGKYADALKNINRAIDACDTETKYYVTRSMILRAMGNEPDAVTSTRLALAMNADDADALVEQACVYIAQGKHNDALASLNLAIFNNAEHTQAVLIRAWLYANCLNKQSEAKHDYAKMLLNDNDDISSLKGFAYLALGREEEALAWAQQIIEDSPLPGGEAYYVAAALISLTENTDKALSCVASALANGYGNYHNLTACDNPALNVAKLKGERLSTLLSQNQQAFKARRLTDVPVNGN
ncbi:MAG: tetratricopeptide repeat protein [Muribaculaceae bacterium]